MKPRIIFIHGNQTEHWSFGWAPWLKKELESQSYETFFETFPDSIIARAQYWLPFLHDHIKAGVNDILIGWSSGATATLRYAEINKIRGSILVAPSITDLDDELEKQSGYFDKPWDWEKIKQNQQNIALIHSDNDPYIPQEQFKTVAEQLQPQVIRIPQEGHFIERKTFPEILNYIVGTYR